MPHRRALTTLFLAGFDIGTSKLGLVLPALDLGTEGMRVGGQRTLTFCSPGITLSLTFRSPGIRSPIQWNPIFIRDIED